METDNDSVGTITAIVCGFPSLPKEVGPSFEYEKQEREFAFIFWGVDAKDLEVGSPSIFVKQEVTTGTLLVTDIQWVKTGRQV